MTARVDGGLSGRGRPGSPSGTGSMVSRGNAWELVFVRVGVAFSIRTTHRTRAYASGSDGARLCRAGGFRRAAGFGGVVRPPGEEGKTAGPASRGLKPPARFDRPPGEMGAAESEDVKWNGSAETLGLGGGAFVVSQSRACTWSSRFAQRTVPGLTPRARMGRGSVAQVDSGRRRGWVGSFALWAKRKMGAFLHGVQKVAGSDGERPVEWG